MGGLTPIDPPLTPIKINGTLLIPAHLIPIAFNRTSHVINGELDIWGLLFLSLPGEIVEIAFLFTYCMT